MTEPVISVEALEKSYGSVRAVDAISFEVAAGEIFGVVGPNGAGKTTTIECLEGLRAPDGGRVHVLGLDPRRDGDALRERIGAQLQESALPAQAAGRRGHAPVRVLLRAARSSPRRSSRGSAWPTGRTSPSPISPAARSSASRSRWRWSAIRSWSSSTS